MQPQCSAMAGGLPNKPLERIGFADRSAPG
jgi:hypothetical protein